MTEFKVTDSEVSGQLQNEGLDIKFSFKRRGDDTDVVGLLAVTGEK